VLAGDHAPSDELADEIKAFVRERLSAYAYPRRIEFVTELPKTLTGKIRRIELRQQELGPAAPVTARRSSRPYPEHPDAPRRHTRHDAAARTAQMRCTAVIMTRMATPPEAPAALLQPAARLQPDAASSAASPSRARVIGGVCAGIAVRLRVAPLAVRVSFALLTFIGGLGVALYVLAWAVVPAVARTGTGARTRRAVGRPRAPCLELLLVAALWPWSASVCSEDRGPLDRRSPCGRSRSAASASRLYRARPRAVAARRRRTRERSTPDARSPRGRTARPVSSRPPALALSRAVRHP